MSSTITPDDLKDFRKAHGLSQAALAESLLVSKRSVENWEGGVREPPGFLRLALYFVDQIQAAQERVALMEAGSYTIGRNGEDITQIVIHETNAQIAEYRTLIAAHKGQ